MYVFMSYLLTLLPWFTKGVKVDQPIISFSSCPTMQPFLPLVSSPQITTSSTSNLTPSFRCNHLLPTSSLHSSRPPSPALQCQA